MKRYFFLVVVIAILFTACGKEGKGIPDAVGGQLPTNYIYISDSAFNPKNTIVTNGNTITFVNQTTTTQGIYSSDSIVINKQGLATTMTYFFKKDTVGTIYYKLAGKPSVNGTITFTP
jgi:plastocyanin